MKIVIIMPTYNEYANILLMLDAIALQRKNLVSIFPKYELQVLVVDDHSPDGTADAVRVQQQTHSWLHLLEGKKEGLGAAYIRGMSYAMVHLDADVVFEMDADFSHCPDDIPRLLGAIDSGGDFVIGSRYVPGGSLPSAWGWKRRLNSLVGNWVARYVVGLYRVRDCTAGFRAIRTSLLRNIRLDKVRTRGYAFQVALLHAAQQQRADVVEVPVNFVERHHGVSKLGFSDITEFIRYALMQRLQDSRMFIKFALVGVSGMFVNLAMFTALLAFHLSQYVASPLAVEVSIVSNFLLNSGWTFRQRTRRAPVLIQGLKFNLVSLGSLVVNYAVFVTLLKILPGYPLQLYQFAGILPAMMINYMANAGWTFSGNR